jgi:hypothetical protein
MNDKAEIMPPQVVTIADPMVSMIERVVMDPNASLDKLERMLAMKERLDATNARKSFDQAISAAKAAIPPIVKDRKVDFTGKSGVRTNYQHEDMAGIARVVDPILGEHGLSYRYRTTQDAGRVTVTCVISHRDGYSEETSLSAGADESGNKNSIQAVGSTITYLQRYTLKAALGLAAANDDDGKGAAPAGTISEAEWHILRDLIEKAGADVSKFLAALGCSQDTTLEELPAAKFEAAKAMLWQKIAQPVVKGATNG